MFIVAAFLVMDAAIELSDGFVHQWGARKDYGNPYLMYDPLRPLITVALPLFWAALLISSPMRRWAKKSNHNGLLFRELFMPLMALFMPSGIVTVEGQAARLYLQKLFSLRFPKRKFEVVVGDFDKIEKKLDGLRSESDPSQEIPFRNRMFFAFDLKHSEKRKRFVESGFVEDNTVVWSKNGIEHFYPRAIMKSIFQCGDDDLKQINVDSEEIEISGIRKSKSELAEIVCAQLDGETVLDDELTNLLSKISNSFG